MHDRAEGGPESWRCHVLMDLRVQQFQCLGPLLQGLGAFLLTPVEDGDAIVNVRQAWGELEGAIVVVNGAVDFAGPRVVFGHCDVAGGGGRGLLELCGQKVLRIAGAGNSEPLAIARAIVEPGISG
jgi:hypothetical protein